MQHEIFHEKLMRRISLIFCINLQQYKIDFNDFFEKKSQVFGVLGQKWTNYGKNEVFQVYQKSVCGNFLILTMQLIIIKLKFDSNEFLGKYLILWFLDTKMSKTKF